MKKIALVLALMLIVCFGVVACGKNNAVSRRTHYRDDRNVVVEDYNQRDYSRDYTRDVRRNKDVVRDGQGTNVRTDVAYDTLPTTDDYTLSERATRINDRLINRTNPAVDSMQNQTVPVRK